MLARIATALLVGALLLASQLAAAEEPQSLDQIVIEMANTPAEHAALASYYRSKAEEARADQRRHEQMARAYGRGKQRTGPPSSLHCKTLAAQYGKMAREYDELAQLHEAEAKQP